jgi:hypothetical protein
MEKNQLKIIIKLKGLLRQALFLSQKEVALIMTTLEMYLTGAARAHEFHPLWNPDDTPGVIRRFIEDRTRCFERPSPLLLDCPKTSSCYHDCEACWNRFFKGFREVPAL